SWDMCACSYLPVVVGVCPRLHAVAATTRMRASTLTATSSPSPPLEALLGVTLSFRRDDANPTWWSWTGSPGPANAWAQAVGSVSGLSQPEATQGGVAARWTLAPHQTWPAIDE